MLRILEPPSSLINHVFLSRFFSVSFLLDFLDVVEYVLEAASVLDILRDILDLSVTAGEIGLTRVDLAVLQVLKALVADYKLEHDSAEELQQLGWRWRHRRALRLYKDEEDVLDADTPILDGLLDWRAQPRLKVFNRWVGLEAEH